MRRFYSVWHHTCFEYDQNVWENHLVLNMEPLETDRQKIKNYKLEIKPFAKACKMKDHYGNNKHFLNVWQSHNRLEIKSSFEAEVSAPAPLPESLSRESWKELENLSEDMWDFLHPSFFAKAKEPLKKFLKEQNLEKKEDPLSSLISLNSSLFSVFNYSPQSTRADSPIDEILSSKKGVCQDYTHVMIAISRLWGIPSRYVSGYLYHSKDWAGSENESHAWCECFLPSLGWRGFDPTNNILEGERHIRLAVGRDYKDVPPHKGLFKGSAREKLSVHVRLKEEKFDTSS